MSEELKYTNKLKGARVLIIGGTSGLGFAAAQAVIEQNISELIISSSSATRIEATIAKLRTLYPTSSTNIIGYPCNLGDEASLPANVENLFSQVGTLDHIIFTAGDAPLLQPFLENSFETIKAAGTIRFFAPLLVAQYGYKHLKPGPASSITLTSGASAEKPIPGWTVTCSYLSGLQGMMRGLALDLKPVRVNLVSPGGVDTEMWDVLQGERAGVVAELARQTTTGRVGQAEDVAEAYIYCLRDWNLSGSIISSNAGRMLV
ncbi:hypothetical protein BJY01DRAFT_236003 [Aspergillus pseudoustus]|uniref:NAD(P)-binding protein n=1 Tax=Aspergillus pseudoustus TaxID=1810923 RepID=A0ABR4JQV0_9EURO